MQKPSRQIDPDSQLAAALQALSAREQIGLLIRATRSLSGRDRLEVWRVAGLSVLRDRLLPVLLHILLKRVLAGLLWWIVCGIAAVLVLLVLAFVEQINSNAVGPVISALVGFFAGFLLFALYDFVRSLVLFFRKTCSRGARDALFADLNARAYPEKLALLRLMSASLADKVPGESLLASLVTGLILFIVAVILLVLVLLLSGVLPVLSSFPWVLLVAGVAFLLGLLGPGTVQHRLLTRSKR